MGKGPQKDAAQPSSPKGAQKKPAPRPAAKEKAKPAAKTVAGEKPEGEAPGRVREAGAASAPAGSGLRSSALGLGSLRGSALSHRRTTLAPLP